MKIGWEVGVLILLALLGLAYYLYTNWAYIDWNASLPAIGRNLFRIVGVLAVAWAAWSLFTEGFHGFDVRCLILVIAAAFIAFSLLPAGQVIWLLGIVAILIIALIAAARLGNQTAQSINATLAKAWSSIASTTGGGSTSSSTSDPARLIEEARDLRYESERSERRAGLRTVEARNRVREVIERVESLAEDHIPGEYLHVNVVDVHGDRTAAWVYVVKGPSRSAFRYTPGSWLDLEVNRNVPYRLIAVTDDNRVSPEDYAVFYKPRTIDSPDDRNYHTLVVR